MGVSPYFREFSSIKELIVEREEKIKAVEEEISQLRERMERLNSRKEHLRTGLESGRAFIAPIRRLHPEILQEIFRHCLPVAHNAVMDSREAPLLLRHVCSFWRRLADESPELWASIHVVIPPRTPYSTSQKPPPHEISSWLSRSGVLPLSISLASSVPPMPPTESLDPLDALYFEAISNPFKSRWKSLWINIPAFNWSNHFFRTFSAKDVPLLEQIHIQGPRDLDSTPLLNGPSFEREPLTREDSILHAPRLRSIFVLPFGPGLLQLSLNWEHITALNLSWNVFHYHDLTKALLLCPNLEACVVSSVDPRTVDLEEDVVAIALPKLRSLTIIDESDAESDISRLIRGLHAPDLRYLAYERRPHWPPPVNDGYQIKETIAAFSTLLGRLINPLEELALVTDSILLDDTMRILGLVPSLKRLSLKGMGRPLDSSTWPVLGYREFVPLFLLRDGELDAFTPGRGRRDTAADTITVPISSTTGDGNDLVSFDDSSNDDSSFPPSGKNDFLCPRLEVIHFTGCMFSDVTMLEFFKARTLHHQKYNVAHLKKVSFSFVSGRDQESGTAEELEKLERETMLRVNVVRNKFVKPRARSRRYDYSPYDGLDASPSWSTSEYKYRQFNFFGFD
ncbi:hypothetical protein AN958_01026 [Leucoagaricus sp. SymC.cos]|nr:hypothetical protein AN958_01026 [Leucoagaricus sp. SymC.cos]